MVLCNRFGLQPSADFPISAGLVCGALAQVLESRWQNLGLFLDGACSGTEIAAAPKEPVRYLSTACSWASALLGVLRPAFGKASGAACVAAPIVGHGLGQGLESKHELDVAVDVIRHGKCIKLSPTHFGSPWLAEACSPSDKGFTTLPRRKPGDLPPPQAAGGGGGPSGPPSGGGGPFPPTGDLVAVPSVLVAGQSFNLENSQCPVETNAAFYEVLPLGEAPSPTSPRVDRQHLGQIVKARVAMLVSVGTSPDFEPGDYQFVLDCLDRSPLEPGARVLRAMRTFLTFSEGGRGVEISPATAAPGETVTLTPLGPCAGTEGGTVTVSFFGPSEVALGRANGSCDWGPSTVKVPSGLSPGDYSIVVVVTDEEHRFVYQSTLLTVE